MGYHTKQLAYSDIKITDALFGEYVRKVSLKIIPHQWKILNDQLEDSAPRNVIWAWILEKMLNIRLKKS